MEFHNIREAGTIQLAATGLWYLYRRDVPNLDLPTVGPLKVHSDWLLWPQNDLNECRTAPINGSAAAAAAQH